MANEVTTTLLGTNGGLVASVLSDLVLEQLYDPSDLSGLMQFIPWNPMGSSTMDVTLDAVPGGFTSPTSETDGSNVVNSAYPTSQFPLAPRLRARRYQLTDLLPISGGPIQVDRAAAKLVEGVGLDLTDLLCALFPSLSTSRGTSGQDLTVTNIYEAQFALNLANAFGPYAAVLYNEQMNNFRQDLRNESGAIQWQDPTSEMLATKGPGYQGRWNNTDFYQSDSVTAVDSNANSAGGMFAAGCFAYTLADPRLIQQHIPASNLIFVNNRLLLELVRDSTNFRSALVAQYYPSVVEREDARGVKLVTDR